MTLNKDANILKKFQPQASLDYVCLHLVEHCNLNCKYCDHFSPLAQEGFLDIKSFTHDMRRLSVLSNGLVGRIGLMGGEPLLHPELPSFLPVVRECFPQTLIQIVTNGILLLKQSDTFWQTCAHYKIEIVFTKYPISLAFDKIEHLAKENSVSFRYYSGDKNVQKTSYFVPLNLQGNSSPRINFLKCFHANNCIFLKCGKLFPCPIAPNANHFNEYFKEFAPPPGNCLSGTE
jgi:hypothetical protein